MQARYLVVKLGQLGSTVCFVVSGLPRLGAPGEWGWRWLRASVLSSIWKPPGVPGNGPGVWHSTATRTLPAAGRRAVCSISFVLQYTSAPMFEPIEFAGRPGLE